MSRHILRTFVVCIFIASFGSASHAADDEILAHWTFDEGKGRIAKDSGPNSLDFRLVKCQWVEGKVGKALYFNGTESYGQVQKAEGKAISLSDGPFTVSMWIKLDKDLKKNRVYEIFNYHCGDWGPGYRLNLYYGAVRFRSGDGRKEGVVQLSSYKPGRVIPRGQWVAIHIVMDEHKNARLYVDGELVDEKERFRVYPVSVAKPNVILGCFYDTKKVGSMGFKGCIDEVRILKKAMSAEEVLKEAKGIEFH